MAIQEIRSADILRIRELYNTEDMGGIKYAIDALERAYEKLEDRLRAVEINQEKIKTKVALATIISSIILTAIATYFVQNVLPGAKS